MARVCVLIINYFQYHETLRYVRNLQKQRGINLSIIVVDNHSPNESFTVLQRALVGTPEALVIQSDHNGGYAFGVNTGLKFLADTPFDYLLISNNDIRLDNDHLVRSLIEEYLKLAGAAFIAPAMYVNGQEDQKHQAWKVPTFKDSLYGSLRSLYALAKLVGPTNHYRFPEDNCNTEPVDCLSGSFFLGSREVFHRIDLWDEQTFLYVEESILGWKIKKLGLQNYLARSLHFHHELGGTTRKLHSLFRLQKHWLESTVHFQKEYLNGTPLQLFILHALFPLWMLETLIVLLFRKLSGSFLLNQGKEQRTNDTS